MERRYDDEPKSHGFRIKINNKSNITLSMACGRKAHLVTKYLQQISTLCIFNGNNVHREEIMR